MVLCVTVVHFTITSRHQSLFSEHTHKRGQLYVMSVVVALINSVNTDFGWPSWRW